MLIWNIVALVIHGVKQRRNIKAQLNEWNKSSNEVESTKRRGRVPLESVDNNNDMFDITKAKLNIDNWFVQGKETSVILTEASEKMVPRDGTGFRV